jgi:N6-adenosine-specific RNA methylase IME4
MSADPFAGLPRKHFKVVYADPAWHFKVWSERGAGKSASQHYATMSFADICALPVAELVADDAVLFLWVVQPLLPEALQVIHAWGFTYKTVAFCWIKMRRDGLAPRLGLGYHTRAGMEQCWLAVRGRGYQRQAQDVAQVLHATPQDHSRKPAEIAQRIERLVGQVPRIELFARGPARKGWVTWGREADAKNGRGA